MLATNRLARWAAPFVLAFGLALFAAPHAQAAPPAAPTGTVDAELTFEPEAIDVTNGFHPTTLTIGGTQCAPGTDAPAAVTVTVDGIDGTFTATPDETGAWSVDVLIDTEDAQAVHAVCDNALGSRSYPERWVPFAAVGAETETPAPTGPTGGGAGDDGAAGGVPNAGSTGSGGALANTGPDNGPMVAVAGGLLVGGAALTWAARRRRAVTA